MIFDYKRWREQDYLLDRMTLRDLVKAYFTYPAIQVYLSLLAVSLIAAVALMEGPRPLLYSALIMVLMYPLLEYVLHRFLLHARWLYKSPRTAAFWKRVHFDHHQNPNDLSVLFGAMETMLPLVALVAIPIGWLIGGAAGIAAALAAGFAIACTYEFSHCIHHLSYKPKLRFLQRIKHRHLAHHFHSERGNFGITSSICDHIFGTFYRQPGDVPRSPTVRNLGYDDAERKRFPWVADLTEAQASDEPARQRQSAG